MSTLIIGSGCLAQALMKVYRKHGINTVVAHNIKNFKQRTEIIGNQFGLENVPLDINAFFHHQNTVGPMQSIDYNYIRRFNLIINATGATNQNKSTDMALVNIYFPLLLDRITHERQYVVHVSTDCVFPKFSNGIMSKNYEYDYEPFGEYKDDYGKSKRIAEKLLLMTTRTAVVRSCFYGPDVFHHGGLFDWYHNTEEVEVPGFIDTYINGIPSITLAKNIYTFALSYPRLEVTHIASNLIYSKYNLLKQFKSDEQKYCESYEQKQLPNVKCTLSSNAPLCKALSISDDLPFNKGHIVNGLDELNAPIYDGSYYV